MKFSHSKYSSGVVATLVLAAISIVVFIETFDNHEEIIQNSADYTFKWNKYTRQVIVRKNNQIIQQFSFTPRPLGAWINQRTNLLAIVTSDDGTIEGNHGLYIYNDQQITKAFQAQPKDYEGKSPKAHLYSFPDSTDQLKYKQELHSQLIIAPNNQYAFLRNYGVSGDKGYWPMVINLKTGQKLELFHDVISLNRLFWSSNWNCFIYAGGDSNDLLGLIIEDKLETYALDTFNVTNIQDMQVYWNKNSCSGVIQVHGDELGTWLELIPDRQLTYFFGKQYDHNAKQSRNIANTTNLLESSFLQWQNIFVTVPKLSP